MPPTTSHCVLSGFYNSVDFPPGFIGLTEIVYTAVVDKILCIKMEGLNGENLKNLKNCQNMGAPLGSTS